MIKKSNKRLARLITAMSDGEFHDGNALGDSLQMTRSAVWKMIKKLERYGVEISSVKGRGYSLCEPLILLDEDQISNHLNAGEAQLHLFESVDSTNDYLKSLRCRELTFAVAEQQTQGRGRLNRSWHSPFGKNIYLSCSYPFQKDISELAGLSLIVSLAILQTLKQFGMKESLHVKWPNDIICGGKKLSGTLIEVQAESHSVSHAIIGVGLNVNMLIDERKAISQSWTSMRKVVGDYIDRNPLCAELVKQLQEYLIRFDRYGFSHFVDEWMESECMLGKHVTLKNINETISGEMAGINAQGHLLLKLIDGQQRAFSSGDTTIVKRP